MSSPFTMPNYGYPDRATVSSPALGPRRTEASQGSDSVSIRSMRLKVLYTFDDQNKTNCLARWPQALDIRTAYLEESTQIGVVELKTCIQAIVSASPELVAKLGQDYTVYAYDYSEQDTPLVGQGMLSWVLGSSSAPSSLANSSRSFVTGRVCKPITGLFSSSSQETLEVKLRLIPVPTCLQSEYMENMNKYRDLSKIMPVGLDPGTWASFLQANPAMMQLASQSRCQSPATAQGQSEGMGREHVQRFLGEGSTSRNLGEQQTRSQSGNFQSSEAIQNHPRPASPAVSVQSATAPPKRRGRPPRNAARGRDTQPKNILSREQVEMTLPTGNDHSEKGPAKKRAKVSKADWTGTAGLGQQPESLRVAASTAASVRIHQPTAIRPLTHCANSIEGPPRAPTPVANPTTNMRRPLYPMGGSTLRRASFTAEDPPYDSPYTGSDVPLPMPPASSMTSPENSHADSSPNTPVDIASSPPVYRGFSTAPSSPKLPTLPQNADSGFMSGPADLFDDNEYQPLAHEELDVPPQNSRRNLPVPTLEPYKSCPVVPPDSAVEPQAQSDMKAIARSRMAARSASGLTSVLNRTTSLGDVAVPSTGQDSEAQPPGSETASLPQPAERPESSGSRRGSGANAKRKQAIQSKLESTVAAGAMPSYCENCGAIETPTWRKAWAKVYQGSPEYVQISTEEEGGIIAWQYLDNASYYRILKRSLLPADEGFMEILLCNPCGIWLHTRKCMRPKEFWEKPPKDEKRKRPPRAKKSKSGSITDQAASDHSQGVTLQSEGSSPAKDTRPDGNEQDACPLPQMNRQRALSEQGHPNECCSNGQGDALAPKRAVRSSPARFVGIAHVPIEVDALTPKPTRRVLFPSPNLTRDQRQDFGNCLNAGKKSREASPKVSKPFKKLDNSQDDKENCPPPPQGDDNLDELFEDKRGGASRPTTPIATLKPHPHLFKTPRKSTTPDRNFPNTGDFFSSVAKALLHPTTPRRTPKQPLVPISPFSLQINQLMSGNLSPSGNSFDFPPIPSLGNTPGGRTRREFDFSEFDNQELLSTDVIMPSSPPQWLCYEDPVEQASSLWNEYQFPSSPETAGDGSKKAGNTGSLESGGET